MNIRLFVIGMFIAGAFFATALLVSQQSAQALITVDEPTDIQESLTYDAAGICGGATPCPCKSEVTSDYTMTADLLNCPEFGLWVTNGATLDCAGHIIDGTGFEFGAAAAPGSTIKNCEVREFNQGMQAETGAQLLDNYSHHHVQQFGVPGWGLVIPVLNAQNVIVTGNTFSDNEYGVYITKGLNNRVTDNVFSNNSIANAYEADAVRANVWDFGGVGNVWDDFSSNPGYPTQYNISGPGPGVDHFPSMPPMPPLVPSNPTPADTATLVAVDQNLSWTGGDPNGDTTTYDILMDTNPVPTTPVATGLAVTNYDPGAMPNSTTYFWQVIAHANGDTTNGPVWSFTTEAPNQAPNVPGSPVPVNAAIDVSLNTLLGWTGGDPDVGDTVTYDVYFGTSATPPLVQPNHPTSNYDPAGTLVSNTTYFWKIVARDSDGAITTGPVWSFTTEEVTYMPGDVNGNGSVTSADIIYLVNYVFKSGPAPVPLEVGDVNCSGTITSADIIYLVNYVFKSGPAPTYCS